MTRTAGKQLHEQALEATARGELSLAASTLEAATRVLLDEGDRVGACFSLTSLAQVLKVLGDPRAALSASDRAGALLTPDMGREPLGLYLIQRGAILDLLGDAPEALRMYERATTIFGASTQPLMALKCAAHAAGAMIAAGDGAGGHAAAGRAIEQAGPGAALIVSLLGAVGESAGSAGLPYLAQAALVVCSRPETFNSSNAPYIVLLADRLGHPHPLSAALCGLAFDRAGKNAMAADLHIRGELLGMIRKRVVAAGQPDTIEALREEINRVVDHALAFPIWDSLRALVPDEAWLIGPR
jgi:hypothetical protein